MALHAPLNSIKTTSYNLDHSVRTRHMLMPSTPKRPKGAKRDMITPVLKKSLNIKRNQSNFLKDSREAKNKKVDQTLKTRQHQKLKKRQCPKLQCLGIQKWLKAEFVIKARRKSCLKPMFHILIGFDPNSPLCPWQGYVQGQLSEGRTGRNYVLKQT